MAVISFIASVLLVALLFVYIWLAFDTLHRTKLDDERRIERELKAQWEVDYKKEQARKLQDEKIAAMKVGTAEERRYAKEYEEKVAFFAEKMIKGFKRSEELQKSFEKGGSNYKERIRFELDPEIQALPLKDLQIKSKALIDEMIPLKNDFEKACKTYYSNNYKMSEEEIVVNGKSMKSMGDRLREINKEATQVGIAIAARQQK